MDSMFDGGNLEIVSAVEAEACGSGNSGALCQGPGDPPAIGDGKGVMSAKGLMAGDDRTEAGEREPIELGAAESVDLTLALRRGRLAVENV